MPTDRHLHVFLCHASHDKPAVRALYDALKIEGYIRNGIVDTFYVVW